jgi:hypothetical protein
MTTRIVAAPAARTQPPRTPDERRALRLILRAVTILQLTRPGALAHTARGIAFRLENGGTPAELALAKTLRRQFDGGA